MTSLPMRGEWIEIVKSNLALLKHLCLSPCGESGLKSGAGKPGKGKSRSLPMRGEWIEILLGITLNVYHYSLSPCGESGLKFLKRHVVSIVRKSLPMRGEWIEILLAPGGYSNIPVSPHAGRVD